MRRLLTVLLAVSLFAVACGSSSPTTASTPSPATSTVQIVIFSFPEGFSSLAKAGATTQVIAIGILANGTTQDVTSTCTNWQSDDTSVLSVNSGGLITAQSNSGAATITMTCRGVSAHGLVTVNPAQPPPPPPVVSPAPVPPGIATPTCDVQSAKEIPACSDFNIGGSQTPTALCNDGKSSCSQTRSGTCSSHGGVKCFV